MPQAPLCRIGVSSQVPPEVQADLIVALESASAQVQDDTRRPLGVDEIALLVIIAAGVGQLVEQGVKVSRAINEWRSRARQKGAEVELTLTHPERPDLHVTATTTDEEIESWFRH